MVNDLDGTKKLLDKVEVQRLIYLVSQEPVIWNKTDPSHYIRSNIKAAWNNICAQLCPRFQQRSAYVRDFWVNTFTKKWRNIRDQYAKSCKKMANMKNDGRTFRRYYVYCKQLAFLNKQPETESGFEGDSTGAASVTSPNTEDFDRGDDEETTSEQYPETRTHVDDIIDRKRIKYEDRDQVGTVDEAMLHFFKSILPSIRDFNDDETLQLQSGVISLVQNIKRQRIFQPRVILDENDSDVVAPGPYLADQRLSHTDRGDDSPASHIVVKYEK